ncbi:MAG TPA: PAS domain S-box protein [Stellaceae bacterium]|nr:PAS domain S-box protein [Stellaceae bacterium]
MADVPSEPAGTGGDGPSAAALAIDREAARAINQRIFDTSLDLILVADRQGNFIRVSPSSMSIIGHAPEQMVGRNGIEFVHPDDLENTREEMRQARRSGTTRNFECRYIHRDGHPVALWWIGVWSNPEEQFFFIGRDVTERQESERRLRQSEARLALAAEITEIGIGSAETSINRAQIDTRFNEIYGFPLDKQEIGVGEWLRRIHPSDRDQVAAAVLPAIREGKLYRGEFRALRAGSGEERWVRAVIRTVLDQNGQPGYFLGVHIDITEEKRAADQLRQAQKMEAIGNLTGGMAHDFNNLLGVIIGNLDLASRFVPDGSEAKQLVQEAVGAAFSGAELTRRLLAFARQQPLRPQRIETNALVSDIVRLLGRILGENIEIALNLADGLWPIVADPAQLEAALTNLATNARDAMPRGGRLTIATANRQLDADYAAAHVEVTPGDYVAIEVTDSGSGMPPEIAERIFEPFFTTKVPGKGTGLGLSMVFGFLKQSGGHIAVYSEPGVGTTFRLYLPRDADETAAATAESGIAAAVRGSGEIVLAVEDNERLRRLVMRQLQGLGYKPIVAANATEALSILEREPVDVVFSDIVMPGSPDGIGLAQQVQERWPSVKVVLTSGFPGTRLDDQISRQNGDMRILSKPYRSEDLGAALREVLGG